MDAGGWQGLGWWCWLRKAPGKRRARTQQQQQAAFEGGHTYMRSAWSRPRSPMKDKPTTRRPPAGPGMDDPDPLGSGAALASTRRAAICAHTVRFSAIHSPPRRCETLTAHTLDDASRACRPANCAVPGRNAREKCGSTLDTTQRARPWGSVRRDLHFAPFSPSCAPTEHIFQNRPARAHQGRCDPEARSRQAAASPSRARIADASP